MKDDYKIENDSMARNLNFLSQDLSDVLISIYSFLRKLALTSDLPVFHRDRLREEKGEEYLREIDKRRKKNREEFYRSLFRKDKKLEPFDIDPEKFKKTIQKGKIGLCKRAIEYLKTLALIDEYIKTLNDDEKIIFKEIVTILENY